MLNQLRALSAGCNQAGRNLHLVRFRNDVLVLIVTAVGQRLVDLFEQSNAALTVCADDNAVRVEEIGHRRAFAQEFGVGGDIELVSGSAVQFHDAPNALAGIDGHGAFFHDNPVFVGMGRNCLGNFSRNRFHIGKVSFTVFGRRCTHRDKNGLAGSGSVFYRTGKPQTVSTMACQKLGKKLFVNRCFAALQHSNLTRVIVYANNFVAQFSKTRCGDQTYIS